MDIFQIKTLLFKLISEVAIIKFPNAKNKITDLTVDQILFIPENSDHGFLSTNIALQLNSNFGIDSKNPISIAEVLVTSIALEMRKMKTLDAYIERVDIAGPGFINFYPKMQLYVDCTISILGNPEQWGKNDLFKSKNILIEFTDPNPFKEFHIGHLMSNCIGESLSRLYEFSGAKIIRLCYQGDVGLHVAKTIWAWRHNIIDEKISLNEISKFSLAKRVKLLGEWYAQGSKIYVDGTENDKLEIREINKLVFSKADKSINQIYDLGKKWSLEAFENIYQKLGTKFKKYYFESETGKIGQEIVLNNLGKTFVKSEDAVIFPGEEYGLHTRVFINSQGLPTYEAKELGLAFMKDKDFSYDLSIIVTANEVNDYFKVLLSVIKNTYPNIFYKTLHIGHGMLRLPQGKMSSRTGNIITGDGLIDLVSENIKEINPKESEKLYTDLAVSAIKFSLLKQYIGKDVIFDLKESVSLHGSTGIYLQYTHARAVSLLEKGKFSEKDNNIRKMNFDLELSPIYRSIFIFPFIVYTACKTQSPNLVASYLLNLAQLYNGYYAENKIVGSENEDIGLITTFLVKITLQKGLSVLGINSVDQM